MVLHGLGVFPQVEVSVAQLAVNSAQRSQVVRPGLDGCFEESHTSPERDRERERERERERRSTNKDIVNRRRTKINNRTDENDSTSYLQSPALHSLSPSSANSRHVLLSMSAIAHSSPSFRFQIIFETASAAVERETVRLIIVLLLLPAVNWRKQKTSDNNF